MTCSVIVGYNMCELDRRWLPRRTDALIDWQAWNNN